MSKHRRKNNGIRLSSESKAAIAKATDITNKHLAAFEKETSNLYIEFLEFLYKHIDAAPKCKAAGLELFINAETFYNAYYDFLDGIKKSIAFKVANVNLAAERQG